MLELLDDQTRLEVDAAVRLGLATEELALHDLGAQVARLVCFVCRRAWIGVVDELQALMDAHEHNPLDHAEWYLLTHRGWPEDFARMLGKLIEQMRGSDQYAIAHYRELSEKLEER